VYVLPHVHVSGGLCSVILLSDTPRPRLPWALRYHPDPALEPAVSDPGSFSGWAATWPT